MNIESPQPSEQVHIVSELKNGLKGTILNILSPVSDFINYDPHPDSKSSAGNYGLKAALKTIRESRTS